MPFAPPKAGEKFSNLGTLGKSFWWHKAPPKILPWTISQEKLFPGILNERNEGNTKFLTKRVSKEKIPKLFPKKC